MEGDQSEHLIWVGKSLRYAYSVTLAPSRLAEYKWCHWKGLPFVFIDSLHL